MKTLSLFTIAIMFAMTGMAQKTTDSSANHPNSQWKQNSDQPGQRNKDKTYDKWNNKNKDSSGKDWDNMDSTRDHNSHDKNMNHPKKKNKMNNRQKADKSLIDSI